MEMINVSFTWQQLTFCTLTVALREAPLLPDLGFSKHPVLALEWAINQQNCIQSIQYRREPGVLGPKQGLQARTISYRTTGKLAQFLLWGWE